VVVLTCLAVGWAIGWLVGRLQSTPPPSPTLAPAPQPTPTASPPGQVSILLLLVDDIAFPEDPTRLPILEGVWVVSFHEGNGQYFVTGFPLDTAVAYSNASLQIEQFYNIGTNLSDSSQFVAEALKSVSEGLATQHRVAVDREWLAAAIDRLGGIVLNGERISGEQMLALYGAVPADDPQARAQFQEQVLESLWEAAREQSLTDTLVDELFALQDQYNPDSADLIGLAHGAVRNGEIEIFIDVYRPPP
jgi:hypothetical protein